MERHRSPGVSDTSLELASFPDRGFLADAGALPSSSPLSELPASPFDGARLPAAPKDSEDAFEPVKGAHWHRGIRFASRSEAACGMLLERFVPGFGLEEHRTFQVPVYDYAKGTTKTIDFLVNGVYVEFHPPRFWREGKRYGDFKNAKEYFDYRRELKSLGTPEEKRAFREETKRFLTERYAEERRRIAARFSGDPQTELIVVTSAESLYEQVIRRFGSGYPSKKEFVREFDAIVAEVKANDGDPELSRRQKSFRRPRRKAD